MKALFVTYNEDEAVAFMKGCNLFGGNVLVATAVDQDFVKMYEVLPLKQVEYRELDVQGGVVGETRTVFGFYDKQEWVKVKLVKKLTEDSEVDDWNRWIIERVR